ncbi:MAG: DUF1722 domain-containing protein [Gudongella sp.]|nr:DUF1722 domain-containing protein [Gudongella sp.]
MVEKPNAAIEEEGHLPVNLIRSYAIKYKQEYILNQFIWEPFPDGLLDIKDTGK